MFYRFIDDTPTLRYIRFCEISEVDVITVSPEKYTVQIIMGNGKFHTKSFPAYEEAASMADSVIRMAASYKRNSTNKPQNNSFTPRPKTFQSKEYRI